MFRKKHVVANLFALSTAFAAHAGDEFTLLDVDGSGALSKEEAMALPGLSGTWDQLDVDADGQLTVEEFSRFKPGEQETMHRGVEMKDKLSGTR